MIMGKKMRGYEHCDAPCPSMSCIRGGNEVCSMEGHCSKELRKA